LSRISIFDLEIYRGYEKYTTKVLINTNFLNTIDKIGLKVHEIFRDRIYENVTDEELILIFNNLESYWFDRDRSALIWFCNEIVGGVPEKTVLPSLVMSLTSSGIGIHDDIIDSTRVKKLKRTIPGLVGANKALVAGDLLIIKGLTSIGQMRDEFDKETFHSLIRVFEEYLAEMAVGEIWEINANKNLDLDLDAYLEMLWKLGVDGEACAKLGAISGKATKEQIDALSYFGRSLGYIIRLKDELKDILNIEGNLETKIMNESIPLALLYIANHSKEYYKKTFNILSKEKLDVNDLKNALIMCYDVDVFKYINQNINKTYDRAISKMKIFPESYAKSMLINILDLKINQSDLEY